MSPPVLAPLRVARAALAGACLAALLGLPARLGAQAAPLLTIDEDCVAFAFAGDGRIAYAVRRIVSVRKIDMQRDDIWVTSLDGKKKRIVDGGKLVQGNAPFSYAVQSLRWSPDGRRLTVELLTSQMIDERGTTREGYATLLVDEHGKEIKIQGADSVIPEASNAVWLADGVTVAYLTEAVKPRLLFAVQTVRPVAGRGAAMLEGHTFAAVDWDPKQAAGVAVERDSKLVNPPKLVWLDLQNRTRRELAELTGFLGNLALSPTAKKVAYFADHQTIEVRALDQPDKATRLSAPFGTFAWFPDESRLLLKRGTPKRSAEFVSLRLPDGATEPVLRSLTFRGFQISPDGRLLGVTSPGKRVLYVYPLP